MALSYWIPTSSKHFQDVGTVKGIFLVAVDPFYSTNQFIAVNYLDVAAVQMYLLQGDGGFNPIDNDTKNTKGRTESGI